MQYSEGSLGRVFVPRLEHGDPMPATLEAFAAEKGIRCGMAVMVGGADAGSRLVVGPEDGFMLPVNPMVQELTGVHEVAAVGTLFPDESGKPVLHMHAACGRMESTVTGCIRAGIVTWQVLEVVLVELVGVDAVRRFDPATGFALLTPHG